MASLEIEELLKNNDAPSETVLQELDELLSFDLNDLKALDKDISDLERRLHELRLKRKEVQERVTRYSPILSPVRRIPSDILNEIFHHCLPSDRSSINIMDVTNCPVLLTHVYASWRRFALSCPRLWTRFSVRHLDVDDLYNGSSDYSTSRIFNERRQMEIRKLKSRIAVVKQWLLRSRICPLSISIYCQTYDTAGSSENVAYGLLRTLAEHSDRWQELELTVPFGVFLKLDRVLVAQELKALTTLVVSFRTSDNYGRMVYYQPTILQAPNLKSVWVSDNRTDLWRLPRTIVMWSKVTNFCCSAPVTPRSMVNLFQNLPNLVNLKVLISTHYARSVGNDGGVGGNQESLSLPLLRTWSLIDQADNIHHMHLINLYRSIDAPGLREVTYASLTKNRPSRVPDSLYIFQKSPNLESLIIDTTNFSEDDIRIILGNVPSLRYLEADAVIDQANLYPHQNFVLASHSRAAVIAILAARCGDSVEGAGTTCLLPRLESVRVNFPCSANEISDETLQSFILSRIDPQSATSTLATLKHVGIVFQRSKQKEIAEITHSRAARIGIDFDLEVIYIPEGVGVNVSEYSEPRLYVLSPRSGVKPRGEI